MDEDYDALIDAALTWGWLADDNSDLIDVQDTSDEGCK